MTGDGMIVNESTAKVKASRFGASFILKVILAALLFSSGRFAEAQFVPGDRSQEVRSAYHLIPVTTVDKADSQQAQASGPEQRIYLYLKVALLAVVGITTISLVLSSLLSNSEPENNGDGELEGKRRRKSRIRKQLAKAELYDEFASGVSQRLLSTQQVGVSAGPMMSTYSPPMYSQPICVMPAMSQPQVTVVPYPVNPYPMNPYAVNPYSVNMGVGNTAGLPDVAARMGAANSDTVSREDPGRRKKKRRAGDEVGIEDGKSLVSKVAKSSSSKSTRRRENSLSATCEMENSSGPRGQRRVKTDKVSRDSKMSNSSESPAAFSADKSSAASVSAEKGEKRPRNPLQAEGILKDALAEPRNNSITPKPEVRDVSIREGLASMFQRIVDENLVLRQSLKRKLANG